LTRLSPGLSHSICCHRITATVRPIDAVGGAGTERGQCMDFLSSLRHVVIDAQCLQTDTVERGIGRYSLNLVRAMAHGAPDLRITLLLNRVTDPRWSVRLLDYFTSVRANVSHLYFDSPSGRQVQFAGARRVAELSREQAISSLNPDSLLILSAFQQTRETILAPRKATRHIPTFAILYDLIPFVFMESFLYTPSLKRAYKQRLSVLQDCDGLLAISNATKATWIDMISTQPPVTVIGGAHCSPPDQLPPVPLTRRRGVLCVGAETPNKNLDVLLDAYARLPSDLRRMHGLENVGIRDSGFRRYLSSRYQGPPGDLSIPPYVTDSELVNSLRSARLLAMPSTMEGLGLPVLEAMEFGTPCVVATGSSLVELSSNPATHFSPQDVNGLRSLLINVLSNDYTWAQLHDSIREQVSAFTWPSVARRTLERLAAGIAVG